MVLLPTRELAVQITDVFKAISKYTDLKIVCLMGGVGQDDQIFDLTVGADVVIATPGRMFDLQSQGYIELDRLKPYFL